MSVFGFKDVLYRIEYNGRVKNAVIEDVSPQEYLVKFDDGSEGWHSKEQIDARWERSQAASLGESTQPDMVNNPAHYSKGVPEGVQVIDIIEAQQAVGGRNNHSQAIKYLLRALLKGNAVQDYEKAVWYLNREIKSLQEAK